MSAMWWEPVPHAQVGHELGSLAYGHGHPIHTQKGREGIALATILLDLFNTMEDAGALPIECDVSKMNTGDVLDIYPYEGLSEGMRG